MLVTLAIIGVVAALTIPTLVQNYQTKAWNTAASVFERKLEEALKEMNVQQTLAGYKTTESFVNELSKHLKITKVCSKDDLSNCFEDKVYWNGEEIDMSEVKSSFNLGQVMWKTNVVGIQLANGTSGVIAYNPKCKQDPYSNQVNGLSCLAILYDTSAYKAPNTKGKDLRGINVIGLGRCGIKLENGTCFSSPFMPEYLTYQECEAVKNELGGFACHRNAGMGKTVYYEHNYWAGAMKTCHELGLRLATRSDLALLASDLYNESIPTIDAGWNNTKNEIDMDKAAEYGFIFSHKFVNDTGFTLFAGDFEPSNSWNYIYLPTFLKRRQIAANYGPENVETDYAYALCVE